LSLIRGKLRQQRFDSRFRELGINLYYGVVKRQGMMNLNNRELAIERISQKRIQLSLKFSFIVSAKAPNDGDESENDSEDSKHY
jgi:hypothetical protein